MRSDKPRNRKRQPVCRHCVKSPVSRPRGLCWGCYYKPGVKDLYPITSKYAPRRGSHMPEESLEELERQIEERRRTMPAA